MSAPALSPPASLALPLRETLDESTFEAFVRAHQRRVFRFFIGCLHDPDLAGSMTQECFLRAWRGRDGFRGEARPDTWLLRIAANLVKDHAKSPRQTFWKRLLSLTPREDAHEGAVPVEPASHAPSPERGLLAREEMDLLNGALAFLSPQQRMVFHLRFVDELPLEDIALAMGLTTGTVKVHLSRAVGALRRARAAGWRTA